MNSFPPEYIERTLCSKENWIGESWEYLFQWNPFSLELTVLCYWRNIGYNCPRSSFLWKVWHLMWCVWKHGLCSMCRHARAFHDTCLLVTNHGSPGFGQKSVWGRRKWLMSHTSARADAILICRRAAGVHILRGSPHPLKHLGLEARGVKYPLEELWLLISLREVKEEGQSRNSSL